MDAINIGGAIAGGVIQGQKMNMENKAKEQEMAVKDYQIKELKKKEDADNRMLALDTIFPQYKDMPETLETLEEGFKANGFKFTEMNGMKLFRQGDLKEHMTLMNMGMDYMGKEVDYRGKMMDSSAIDMTNNYSKINQMIVSKKRPDGSAIKDEELEALKKESQKLLVGIQSLATTKKALEKINVEKAKKEAAFAERTYWGVSPDGQQINIDKAGRFWIGNQQMAQPPAGSKHKSVETAEAPRTTNVFRVGGEAKDSRTSAQKHWDGLSPEKKKEYEKKGIDDPIKLQIYMNQQSKTSSGGVPQEGVDLIGG